MANRYWVGGSGDWSDNTNHWSATSNGTPGADVPTSSDNVFIDSNSGLSGGTITVDLGSGQSNPVFLNFNSVTGYNYSIFPSVNSYMDCYGSFVGEIGLTFGSVIKKLTIDFYSSSNNNIITLGGMVISGAFEILNGNGTFTLQDDLVCMGEFYHQSGTFDANDHNVTANDFYFYADTGKRIQLLIVTNFGTNYQVGDILAINGGTGGLIHVDGVDGFGAVNSYWTSSGYGYSVSSGVTTTGGHGTGLMLDITQVSPSYIPTVIMGSGTWEITGLNAGWYVEEYSGEIVTITPETSTIKFTGNNSYPNFNCYLENYNDLLGIDVGKTYYNIWVTKGCNIVGSGNIFNDIKADAGAKLEFDFLCTTYLNTFTATGTAENLITISRSGNLGTDQFTLSKPSGVVSCDYLNISNCNATGGATWYAGKNSVDSGNNDGWIFSDQPIGSKNTIKNYISNSISI